jgi:hypothetical protein
VLAANNRDDFDVSCLKACGHFDWHNVTARAADDNGSVYGREIKVTQYLVSQSRNILEEHRLSLTICSHNEVVEGQRKLNNRIPAWKGSIAWPHFLNHHPTVTASEDVHHTPGENGVAAPLGGELDIFLLGSYTRNDSCTGIEVAV